MLVSHKSGFSLIELLIVLLIMASTATIGIYSLHFLDRSRIKNELHLLHNTCMYLQRKAIATRQEQELTFNRAHNSYSFDQSTHQLPACMQFGTRTGIMGPPSSAKHPIATPITFAQEHITFYPDGTVQAGAVYLTDQRKQLQYALTCGVAQIVYIRLYEHIEQWKQLG